MFRNLRSRRRTPVAAYLCALISALLLLLSVSLLYSRLSLFLSHPHSPTPTLSLLSDSSDYLTTTTSGDDPIDELDIIDEQHDDTHDTLSSTSLFFFDPLTSSIRRSFHTPRSIHQWDPHSDDDLPPNIKLLLGSAAEDPAKAAFASDDVPVDDRVRSMAAEVRAIEDLILVKTNSPLREGWGHWFDKKAVFLRKDRMFRSNFEVMNPLNNPLLQDPDGVGATGFTRGDRIVQKLWMNEFKKVPFTGKKILNVKNSGNVDSSKITKGRIKRRTLNDKNGSVKKDISDDGKRKSVELGDHIYADGNSWGYYPGLPLHLTFTEFMDAFFRLGKCDMRVFMVWNSPPWMSPIN